MFEAILKRFGYERTKAFRRSGAGFQSATISRLTADSTFSELSADSEIRQDSQRLRAKTRKLVNDNGYAQKAIYMLKTNVIGENGLDFRNMAKDPDTVKGGALVPGKLDVFANKLIEEKFYEWARKQNCTVTRRWDLKDTCDMVLESVGTTGEALVRKVKGFNNPFNFALQVFETDHLDLELNRSNRDGNEIRMGIEYDKWRAPIAYHLLRNHPNDNFYPSWAGPRYQAIPVSEIIHPFIPRRPGQSRGYPWFSTAMTQLNMLGKYEEAEVTAAREGACKGGFIETTNGEVQYNGPTDTLGQRILEVEPGMVQELPQGQSFKEYDPKHPNSNYGSFMKTALRGIAAGLGHISYNTLANDMESVNFASGKLGIDEERQGWKVLQVWFATHFLEALFTDWLEMAIMSGQVPLPMSKFDKFNAPCFTGRRWDFIDPEKEINAIIKMMNCGLTSISHECMKRGLSRDAVFQAIADDKKAAEALGLQFKELTPDPDPIEIEEAKAKLRPPPVKAAA